MTVEIETEAEDLEGLVEPDPAVFVTGFTAEYAAPVNYGSEAHFPPLKPMERWTRRMGWDNPGLERGMSEDEMWEEVNRRRNTDEPMPSAWFMALHINENGTRPMLYASDAFDEAASGAESFVGSRDYGDNATTEEVLRDFTNWTSQLAQEKLINRVSRATTGASGLLGSAYPAVRPEDKPAPTEED